MELHIIFFILAGLLIAVLAGFSLWSARREKSNVFSNNFSDRPIASVQEKSGLSLEIPDSSDSVNAEHQPMPMPEETAEQISQEVQESLTNIKISLPGASQPTQEAASPQPAVQPYGNTYGERLANQTHWTNNTVSIAKTSVRQSVQPVPQPAASEPAFAAQSVAQPTAVEPVAETPTETAPPEAEQPQQAESENRFATLYIYAPQGEPFRGDDVVHHLEEFGLRFGEYQIFHRHQYADDSLSPIIYSVANLLTPGTFDLHNITDFSTPGLVLFMQLPTESNDIANMRALISSGEHLAEVLGGNLYDDEQQPFDDQSRQRYMQRVMH